VSLRGSRFPDPATAPGDGPLAVGGDLEPETLVEAYSLGIFPWPDSRGRLSWWSPDPRAVFPVGKVHVSRTLARTLRSGRFRCTVDRAFAEVVGACAHRPGEGTWIVPAMRRAYVHLHELGLAHSAEVWEGDELVGGIYGVSLGSAFMGESMFHRTTDASKAALVHLDRRLDAAGFRLFDAQLPTPHLERMGAEVMPRSSYLRALAEAVRRPAQTLT
jgi:leucyl/phenylalanyl-tRNA---protein transferase